MTESSDVTDRLLQSVDGSEVRTLPCGCQWIPGTDRLAHLAPNCRRLPADHVRAEAEKWHGECGTDEDFEFAFCSCWADACKAVGPCGECYACSSKERP